ncbi:MAG TPA: bacterio-opsin activator domain-containing protein [Halococcus sp.]|nr:bacterio-opsin activator domain-containing protein [Halococcus sp.]
MATIAEIELDSTDFALYETLDTLDGIEFEVERVVAHDTDYVMPYVWVSGTDRDTIEDALAADPSVEDVELQSDNGDHWLYQMRWTDQIHTLVQLLVEEDSTILTAFGKEGRWDLRVLFPDREALSRIYEYYEDSGLPVTLRRVYDHDDARAKQYALTDEQKEALTTGFEKGFFEVPRAITLNELADELDISHQALSERLRRAYSNMVHEGLLVGGDIDRESERDDT